MKRRIRKFIALGLMALVGITGCINEKNEKVLTREIPFTKEGTLSLVRSTND